ncbi:hypothetical protein HXX76_010861 [Chlamydomonas incerta]|uniref:Uncharacterized protein n=1 Tax=Chlamydomonas incerta TaxID=51695 RepID=A0A835SZG5_CHLIN|nr:hypothetical protein HXX76_010861 [Chlamydomonas incerta]|eukprot:KAG2429630.1 hypothetical protein HXX76_010861 [Chlamydomonas incerta]
MALFQTFYRHGLLPVMEIVFVLQKTQVVENERIEFESVWGMPMSGSVSFRPLDGAAGSRTEVTLEFAQALPTLLVDLKVGVFGVQNSLRPILSENLVAFKELAEELAAAEGAQKGKGGQGARPRPEAGDRQYLLFDERADVQAYAAMIDMLDDAAVRQQEQAAADEERERAAAAAAALSQQESVPAAGVPAGQQGPGTEAAGTAPAGGRARAGRATRRTTRTTTDAAGGPAVAGRGASDAAAAAGQGQGQGPDDRSSGRKRSVRSTRGAS